MLVAGGGAEFGMDFQDYLTPVFATDNPLPVTAVAAVIQHNTSGLISLKEFMSLILLTLAMSALSKL